MEILFSVALPGSRGWHFLLKLFHVKWVGWVAPKILVCCGRDAIGFCATAPVWDPEQAKLSVAGTL